MDVFFEENWLQVLDHVATVFFGALTLILTIIVIHLEIKDETKTIAINELQTQTKELKNIYLQSIQPRFSLIKHTRVYEFHNVGGDCYDIIIKPENENLNSFPKSMAAKTSFNTGATISGIYEFTFKDSLGNMYKQIYDANKKHLSNLEQIKASEESQYL